MQNTGQVSNRDAKILILDDQQSNVRLLEEILLGAGYNQITSTTDSREGVSLFVLIQPDLILLDLMMPHLDGFQVMEQLQPLVLAGNYVPILVLTADIDRDIRRRALAGGASDFLTKPFDSIEVLLRIRNLLELRFSYKELQGQNQTLEEKVRERTMELEKAQIEILERLAHAAEWRDDATGQHTRRIGRLAARAGRVLGFSQDETELTLLAAPLHDVGKIGIPDSILLKPGKLTPTEFDVMKTHTTIGANMLSGGSSDLVKAAETIALTHHERWDGSGYPQGLVGDQIPIVGRIVSIVDVYDALTHDRPYKKAWSPDEAVAEIERQNGRQFDPKVVAAFLRVLYDKDIA
jgi:putative two-component system response regulator